MALAIISQGAQSDLEKLFGVAWVIWGMAIRMIEDFKNANNLLATGKRNEVRALKPPPEGVFLINVDGAIPAMDGHSGVGVVIRDWENQVVAAISLTFTW